MTPAKSTSASPQDGSLWLSLMRPIGYVILLLTAFDIIHLFIPPDFRNAAWELGVVAGVVERIPVPLLGCLCIYYGGRQVRRRWEPWAMWLITWGCLVVGLLYFLTVPLAISSSSRLGTQVTAQANAQVQAQLSQLRQNQQQVQRAQPQQLQAFLSQLRLQGQAGNIQNPAALKSALIEQFDRQIKATENTAKQSLRTASIGRAKNLVKWAAGAVVTGFTFLYIWRIHRSIWPFPRQIIETEGLRYTASTGDDWMKPEDEDSAAPDHP
ncbi:MAG: hypothetical protein IGQ88_05290 [Gloeomargaritaceae cyanobacterium C42_A2020_066]|nr:hypothetical protein [Gloeomargaritaceae cyanobacterium C42_A2020_066]